MYVSITPPEWYRNVILGDPGPWTIRFLKKFHETPFYMNKQHFWCFFCCDVMGKGELFRVENRNLNFAM